MRKIRMLKKGLSILAISCLVIGLMPVTHITDVFADEGDGAAETQAVEQPSDNEDETNEEQSSPAEAAPDEEQSVEETQAPAEEDAGQVEEPQDDTADDGEDQEGAGEETEAAGTQEESSEEEPLPEDTPAPEDALTEEPAQEAETETVSETEEAPDADGHAKDDDTDNDTPVTTESVEEDDEDLTDVVDALNEGEFVLENSEGEVIPLASNEASEVLNSNDPFFWNPATNQWEGYTTDGTGCPSNVACFAAANPFQAAVDAAPAGSVVYVAQNTYNEDVTLNTANLTFVGFSSIEVPDASSWTMPTYTSGYAVVSSITLNVNFGMTLGVYADYVVVNAGGRLDDGLALADVDGEVEADVVIYGSDGDYRVRDANHSEINYEWECGEPDVKIWPGKTYRMIFKRPTSQDIIDYYTANGDETEYDRTALTRMYDLLEGIRQSEIDPSVWTHTNEERIFWYLLGLVGNGNNGEAANGTPTTLTAEQKALADAIINRLADTEFMDNMDTWFLWPIMENGEVLLGMTRQLTFMHYLFENIPGCTDPAALNYNPKATEDDGSCDYEDDPGDPGDPGTPGTPGTPVTTTTTEGLIPVTGGAGGPTEELLIIPVTGVDLSTDVLDFQEFFLYMGMLFFGFTMLVEGITARLKIKN